VSRVGWWLLAAITLVFGAMVAAIFWRPDKWTGLVLVGLFGIYVGAMLIVGTSPL
jgi:hypothetical protein